MASTDHALIVADGDVDAAWLGLLLGGRTKPLLIAADGGAAKVRAAGHKPDVVLGDFDSLAADARDQLEALGVELRVSARDKDESDMELCLLAALEAGVARISILGALGGVRPEHSIANLLLLADPRLDGIAIEITLAWLPHHAHRHRGRGCEPRHQRERRRLRFPVAARRRRRRRQQRWAALQPDGREAATGAVARALQ